MQIIAEQKNTRQSPRKVRLVANAVRKLSLEQALRQLAVIERRSTLVVTKVIRQALANAWHNHNLAAHELKLSNIIVNEGPTYKRWRAVSRGRGHSIFKRTSHVRVILETQEKMAKGEKAEKVAAPAQQAGEKSIEKPVQKSKSARKPAQKKAAKGKKAN